MTSRTTFKIRGNLRTVMTAESDMAVRRCFPLMKELRPSLESEDHFLARVRELQTLGDWRLLYVESEDAPVAVAGFRIAGGLEWAKALYVEDQFCLPAYRARGFSKALLRRMEEIGRHEGCGQMYIEADPKSSGAQRFYERIDYTLSSYRFRKCLV